MHKLHSTLLIFLFSFICNYSFAQPAEKLSAKDYLAEQDYNRALEEYLKLYKSKKTDPEINFQIGFCYLAINDDKSKAIPYLELVYNKGGYKDELLLYMGLAYMHGYKFDDAIKFFNEYKTKIKKFEEIDRYIQNCENAKTFVKTPVNVTFENLGKEINSKFPDYYPFVTQDQSTLYYTTRREGRSQKLKSWQGYFTSDIYFSKVVAGQWTKPKSIGPMINSAEDEQCVYVTPDGKRMIVYMDNELGSGDLFMTTMKNKAFPRPVGFIEPVNTLELELEGCITEDGNMLIISSDRPAGLGETDLYMFKKLPVGEWGNPINLGPNVNTKYKEAFPVYDEKNKVLYFASEGHSSMGGSDIFTSKFDTETQTFGPAVNMGYPINTPEENLEFTLAANKRDGYIAAVRKEGFGDLDIYKVIFNDVENQASVVKGIISTSDTLKKEIDALVSIIDEKTNEKIDSKNANPISGKYVFSVYPGKYIITVTSPGFEDYKEVLNVFDKSDYVFEIEKNIKILKPGESVSTTVKDATKGTNVTPVKTPPKK